MFIILHRDLIHDILHKLFIELANEVPHKLEKSKHIKANLLGVVALFFWVIEPFIIERIRNVPLFLLLGIAFLTASIVSAIHITKEKQWEQVINQPWVFFVAAVLGVWGSDFLYIYAARISPIAYVEFIDYLWPPLFVLFACLASQHKFCYKEMIAHVCSTLGLLLLLDVNLGIIKSINVNYMGYALALLGAMVWAGFLTYSKSRPKAPSSMVGLCGGIGGLISLAFHVQYETLVMPSIPDLGFAVLLGLTGFGLAYQFWDYGVKHGNVALLSQANYLFRLLGIVLLFIFTEMPITSNLMLGGGLILATFVASNWQYIRNAVYPLARILSIDNVVTKPS